MAVHRTIPIQDSGTVYSSNTRRIRKISLNFDNCNGYNATLYNMDSRKMVKSSSFPTS